VKAGNGHFEFSRSQPSCLFCCSSDDVFFAAQTWCPFRFAHILLHLNVKNDVVAETI